MGKKIIGPISFEFLVYECSLQPSLGLATAKIHLNSDQNIPKPPLMDSYTGLPALFRIMMNPGNPEKLDSTEDKDDSEDEKEDKVGVLGLGPKHWVNESKGISCFFTIDIY
jgi:hypothetical protein